MQQRSFYCWRTVPWLWDRCKSAVGPHHRHEGPARRMKPWALASGYEPYAFNRLKTCSPCLGGYFPSLEAAHIPALQYHWLRYLCFQPLITSSILLFPFGRVSFPIYNFHSLVMTSALYILLILESNHTCAPRVKSSTTNDSARLNSLFVEPLEVKSQTTYDLTSYIGTTGLQYGDNAQQAPRWEMKLIVALSFHVYDSIFVRWRHLFLIVFGYLSWWIRTPMSDFR